MRFLLLLTLTLTLTSNQATGENSKLKNSKFEAKGIGTVQIKHEDIGEPIILPERVEVFVICASSKRTVSVGAYRTCLFEKYEYEEGIKTITLTLLRGRVDPASGKVICDKFDAKTIDLTKVCKK